MVDLMFRHSFFRKGQKEIVQDAWRALQNNSNLLLSAPTGCGKTDAVLSPAISFALQNDLSVFFLTPKISQHEIACSVVRGIAQKYEGEEISSKLRAVDFVGRRHMCLDDAVRESDAFYELCNRRKKKNSCEYFSNCRKKQGQSTLAPPKFEELASAYGSVRGHQELFSECKRAHLCPYEAATKIAQKSSIVICDFHHLFSPSIREVFLARLEKMVENSVVIVDEAHNLPAIAREMQGATLKLKTIERAAQEAKAMQSEELERALSSFAREYAGLKRKLLGKVGEVFVEPQELEEIAGRGLEEFSRSLAGLGMEFLERFNKSKSASLRVAAFLANWDRFAGTGEYCQIVHREKGLRLRCLDASKATGILNNARCSIAMSGTLLPLEYYRDVLGLDKSRTLLREYSSPFPAENKLNLVVDSVTTRYSKRSDAQFRAIAGLLQSAIRAMGSKNAAIFFPAYSVMNGVLVHMDLNNGNFFVQRPSMSPADTAQLLREFREKNGVLCGVAGGSLSEGLDYDKGELKCIAIVGVPIAELDLESKALVNFFDKKYAPGSGFNFAVLFPAMNKAVQAGGRGIRKESDKCAVLYLDERYAWNSYAKSLPQTETFALSNEPWLHFPQFFEKGGQADAIYS